LLGARSSGIAAASGQVFEQFGNRQTRPEQLDHLLDRDAFLRRDPDNLGNCLPEGLFSAPL
jgi:hypothetical protein